MTATKRWTILFGIVFGVGLLLTLFIARVAFGTIIDYQELMEGYGTFPTYKYMSISHLPTSTINSITLITNDVSATTTVTVYQAQSTTTNSNVWVQTNERNCLHVGGDQNPPTDYAVTTFTIPKDTTGENTFSFASPLNIVSDHNCLSIRVSNSLSIGGVYAPYTSGMNGFMQYNSEGSGGNSTTSLDGIVQPFFKLNGSTGSDTDLISITFPTNGTTTRDFANWYVNYTNASSGLSNNLAVKVNFSVTSGNFGSSSIASTFDSSATTSEKGIIKFDPLGVNVYKVYASLIDNQTVIATSSIIYFTVTSGAVINNFKDVTPTGMNTATTTAFNLTCDPSSSYFEQGLCKMVIYLFMPSTSVLNQFKDIGDQLSTKPPFGYFTIYKNALNGVSTSTPSMTFVAPNWSWLDSFRNGVTIILWLFFAIFVIRTLRHLEL